MHFVINRCLAAGIRQISAGQIPAFVVIGSKKGCVLAGRALRVRQVGKQASLVLRAKGLRCVTVTGAKNQAAEAKALEAPTPTHMARHTHAHAKDAHEANAWFLL